MVDLMLDDLGRPAGEIPDVGLHLTILPLHLNGAVPPGPALHLQRQAAFLGQVQPLAVDDDRVEHLAGCAVVVKHDDRLVDADHIGGHADAAVLVRLECIQQIVGGEERLFVCACGWGSA